MEAKTSLSPGKNWICNQCNNPECNQILLQHRAKIIPTTLVTCDFHKKTPCCQCVGFYASRQVGHQFNQYASGYNLIYDRTEILPSCYCHDAAKLNDADGHAKSCATHGISVDYKHRWVCLKCNCVGYHLPSCIEVVNCAIYEDHDCAAMIAVKLTEQYKETVAGIKKEAADNLLIQQQYEASKNKTRTDITTDRCSLNMQSRETDEELVKLHKQIAALLASKQSIIEQHAALDVHEKRVSKQEREDEHRILKHQKMFRTTTPTVSYKAMCTRP